MAEAVEIPWKNDESYDDWEAVEESLFRHFVVTPLLFDVNPKTINQFVQYKSAPKNLSAYNFFRHDGGKSWVFIGLRTSEAPFDTCLLKEFCPNTLETVENFKFVAVEKISLSVALLAS